MFLFSVGYALSEALLWLRTLLTPTEGMSENPCTVSGMCERVLLPSYLQQVPKIKYQFWPLTGSKKRHFRMLCVDGGGVRSIFSARILERLTDAVPGFLDHIDLIAGSSTGCITVLLLGLGYSPRQIMALYRESMPAVFETSWFRRLNPFRSRYSGFEKFQQIHGYVGDMSMRDLQRFVMITAFCVDAIGDTQGVKVTWARTNDMWRPALFTNMPKGKGRVEPDSDLLLVDAAMRCTAGPAFYPIYQGYVDGAVFGSNPSLSALSRAMESFPDSVTTANAAVLSVGNGTSDSAVRGKYHDWGIVQWATKLIGLLFEGTESSNDVIMRMLLGKRYMRIKNTFPLNAAIDDISSFDKVVEHANKVDLSDAIAFIRNEILEVEPSRRSRAYSIADPVTYKRRLSGGESSLKAPSASSDTTSPGAASAAGSSPRPPSMPMAASAYTLRTPARLVSSATDTAKPASPSSPLSPSDPPAQPRAGRPHPLLIRQKHHVAEDSGASGSRRASGLQLTTGPPSEDEEDYVRERFRDERDENDGERGDQRGDKDDWPMRASFVLGHEDSTDSLFDPQTPPATGKHNNSL